jgi:hypothetical protein
VSGSILVRVNAATPGEACEWCECGAASWRTLTVVDAAGAYQPVSLPVCEAHATELRGCFQEDPRFLAWTEAS